MQAFSSWMLLIHSPPDLITSLLLKQHTAPTNTAAAVAHVAALRLT
jgi:hypothetical protein